MNPDPSKLRQQHEQREQLTTAQAQQQRAEAGREFGSVEELIRFDAQQAVPPERISERLKESVGGEPPPAKSWWRRLFGGGS